MEGSRAGSQPGCLGLPPGLTRAEASPPPPALPGWACEGGRGAGHVPSVRPAPAGAGLRGCADLRATFHPWGGGWVGAPYTSPGVGLGLGSRESSPSRRDGRSPGGSLRVCVEPLVSGVAVAGSWVPGGRSSPRAALAPAAAWLSHTVFGGARGVHGWELSLGEKGRPQSWHPTPSPWQVGDGWSSPRGAGHLIPAGPCLRVGSLLG